MSDHNFEKQVRQKLDDLRLTPSPQAWGNIEREIGHHRRRRTPLLWLGLVILGLGAGGYFILTEPDTLSQKQLANSDAIAETQTAVPEQPQTTAINELPKTIKPGSSTEQPQAAVRARSQSESGTVRGTVSPNQRGSKKPLNAASARVQTPKGGDAPETMESQRESSKISPRPIVPESEVNVPVIQGTANNLNTNSSFKLISHYTTIPSTQQQSIAKPLKASAFNLTSPATLKLSPAEAAASPLLQKPKKWSFGVSVFAGISGMNDNLFLDLKKNATGSNFAVNAAFAAAPHTPFKIAPDFAYSAGLVVKYELSKRFQISSGINYQQLNTRFKLGNRVFGYQAVNAAPFAAPAPYVRNYFTLERHEAQNLKNTYHFAELPVTLHTRLTNSRNLPIYWNFSLSWSQLLSSNSMQFDSNTGVYYSNKNSLHKTQFGINTGFDFVAFSRTKMPLWIGPAVRHNIKPVGSNGFASGKYFLSGGVNVKLFIR